MNCRCPKCSTTIEFERSDLTEAGLSSACPSCRASLVIVTESFSGRVFRRGEQLLCAHCGAILGSEPHCTDCGTPFPSYILAEEARRHRQRIKNLSQKKPLFSGLSLEFSLKRRITSSKKIAGSGLTLESSGHVSARGAEKEKSTSAMKTPSRIVTVVMLAIIVLAAAGGGYYFYHRKAQEKEFITLSMKALYRVKGGKDLAADACKKLLSSYPSTGRMKLAPDEEARIRKAGEEIDRTVSELAPPKDAYGAVVEQLRRMNQAGSRYRTLALSPPPTDSALADAIQKVEGEFSEAAQAFKRGMPETMQSAFADAKRVYRPLQNF